MFVYAVYFSGFENNSTMFSTELYQQFPHDAHRITTDFFKELDSIPGY